MQFQPAFVSYITGASSDKPNHLALAILRTCLAGMRQTSPLEVYTGFLFSLLNNFIIVFYNRSKLV